jgi:hypothetical protein
MVICAERGRPVSLAGAGGGAGVAVGAVSGGGVVDGEAGRGVGGREGGGVVAAAVVVGVSEVVDKRDVMVAVEDGELPVGLMQKGEGVSPPPHVCLSAQQMEPHWKSPAAQTLAQPGPVAPDGQQRKAPSRTEHVSPMSPVDPTVSFDPC